MTAVAVEGEVPTPSPPARRRGGQGLAALVALVLAAALLVAVAEAAGGRSDGVADAEAREVVAVGEGETAWEVLKPHTPEGTAHEVFVHEVLRANEVDARELRPGDVLLVPAGRGG
jgi:hypothetical protein